MTALERDTFGWAAAVYPLTSATTNSALQDADPSVFYALDFWKTVLNTHLGGRWSAEATAAGRADLASKIVAQTSSYDPAPYLKESQFKFPLLSCYRMRAVSKERTIAWENTESRWGVSWIMPPLAPHQAERLMPFLKAVFEVLVNRTTNQSDASYASNAQVWHDLAKLEMIDFESVDYRPMLGLDNLVFPTMTGIAVVTERQMPVAGAFDNYSGADVSIVVDKGNGSTVPFEVEIAT